MSYVEDVMAGPQVGSAIIQIWKTTRGAWVCKHTAPKDQVIDGEAARLLELLVAELNKTPVT